MIQPNVSGDARSENGLLKQFKRLFMLLLLVYVPLMAIFLLLTIQRSVPLRLLLDDATATAQVPFYVGLLSNIAILLWMSSAAVCLFTYSILQRVQRSDEITRFLLISGLLTAFLAIDDLALLHDEVFSDYLGIPEPIIFGVYGLLLVAYVMRFRGLLARSEYLLLLIALLFFAISLAVDNLQEVLPEVYAALRGIFGLAAPATDGSLQSAPQEIGNVRYMLEDGSKFFGIVAWSLYFLRFCWQHLLRLLPTKADKQANRFHDSHGASE